MKPRSALFMFTIGLASLTFASENRDRFLGVNLGLSPSKTFLGGYYSWDRNQINLGTNLFAFTFEEGVFLAQPTLTYNRYLTDNGLYASVALQTTYLPESHDIYTPPTPPDTVGSYRTVHESDWDMPMIMTGIGKSFQFTNWGLHFDVNAITPLNDYFGKVWGLWVGGAASYRFKLD